VAAENGKKQGFIILDGNYPDLHWKLLMRGHFPKIWEDVIRLDCVPEEEEVLKAIQELAFCRDIALLAFCFPVEHAASTAVKDVLVKHPNLRVHNFIIP
jgi:hypothetical protein